MIHDRVASVLSLARRVRDGIDARRLTTEVQSAELQLLLDTLIMLGTPKSVDRTADAHAKTVAQSLAALVRTRDEAQKVIAAEQQAQEAVFEASKLQRNA